MADPKFVLGTDKVARHGSPEEISAQAAHHQQEKIATRETWAKKVQAAIESGTEDPQTTISRELKLLTSKADGIRAEMQKEDAVIRGVRGRRIVVGFSDDATNRMDAMRAKEKLEGELAKITQDITTWSEAANALQNGQKPSAKFFHLLDSAEHQAAMKVSQSTAELQTTESSKEYQQTRERLARLADLRHLTERA